MKHYPDIIVRLSPAERESPVKACLEVLSALRRAGVAWDCRRDFIRETHERQWEKMAVIEEWVTVEDGPAREWRTSGEVQDAI